MKKKALQKNNTNNSTQVLIFNSNSYNDNRGTVLSSDNRTVLLSCGISNLFLVSKLQIFTKS